MRLPRPHDTQDMSVHGGLREALTFQVSRKIRTDPLLLSNKSKKLKIFLVIPGRPVMKMHLVVRTKAINHGGHTIVRTILASCQSYKSSGERWMLWLQFFTTVTE